MFFRLKCTVMIKGLTRSFLRLGSRRAHEDTMPVGLSSVSYYTIGIQLIAALSQVCIIVPAPASLVGEAVTWGEDT
jgi:hypothetical protein